MKYIVSVLFVLFMAGSVLAFPVVPEDGIWKSEDGTLSVYIQKYETGACLLIVGPSGGELTAFIDPDFTDGITASDTDQLGYNLKFRLKQSNSGMIMVELPGFGVFRSDISLAFPAF